MNLATQLLIICPAVFFAGFVDAIAGGGGLISLPAYIITGLPMHNILATSKVMSTVGTGTSTIKYIKSGKVHWKTAITSAVFSFIGSWAGSQFALMIDQTFLKRCFTIILPFISIFVLFNKKYDHSVQKLYGAKMYIASSLIGFIIGIYDGLIGPGAGTFMILGFTIIIGFDYMTAGGNAKIVNLSSNLAAAVNFIISGKVLWIIAIPAAIFNILGNYLGSIYAIKNGNKAIKKILIFVLIGIFIKLISDVI